MRASKIHTPLSLHEHTSALYGVDWDLLYLGVSFVQPAPPPLDSVVTRYRDPQRNPALDNGKGQEWYSWESVLEGANPTATPDYPIIIPTYNA